MIPDPHCHNNTETEWNNEDINKKLKKKGTCIFRRATAGRVSPGHENGVDAPSRSRNLSRSVDPDDVVQPRRGSPPSAIVDALLTTAPLPSQHRQTHNLCVTSHPSEYHHRRRKGPLVGLVRNVRAGMGNV
ncbi:hypothetical protein E2542_SST27218 [Spatholobus suberectus]|nr:hypothetical protein E2542_SST27218 [Spatholobus suberectus]